MDIPPESVEELVEVSLPNPQDFASSGGQPPARQSREDRLQSRAFEMFLADPAKSLGDIAKELGCSRQYLYRVAKAHNWADRRLHVAASVVLADGRMAEAVELAMGKLQARLGQRIQELEEMCGLKGKPTIRLKAIIAWLTMAGVGKSTLEGILGRGGGITKVEVHNDLSDNRQVTVVKESPHEQQDVLEASDETGTS